MAPRRPTPAQIRERRSKIAAIVLGGVFLLVAVLQGPKLLSSIQGSNKSSPAETTTQAAGSATLATATAGSSGTVVAAASLSPGQLTSFSLLKPQAPFHSQLPAIPAGTTGASGSTTKTAASSSGSQATTTPTETTTPAATTTATTATTATTTTATTTTPTAPATPVSGPPVGFTTPSLTGVRAAVVMVNGHKELIGAGGTFPAKWPLFKLTSFAGAKARVGVVGGSFSNGQPSITMAVGHELTLLDKTNGMRFVIMLKSLTRAPVEQLTSPTATTAAPTAAPPTTPATTTTPTG